MIKSRFEVLDSWRGLCALMVALYHLNAFSHFLEARIIRHSFIFVDFFFVLSGFVINHAYGRRLRDGREFMSFATRRLGRIWPLNAAMIACFFVLEIGKLLAVSASGIASTHVPFSGTTSPAAFASGLLLLQGTPLIAGFGAPNGVSWSISAEYWTYLLFALAVLSFARPTTRRLSNIVLALLAATCAIALYTFTDSLGQVADFAILRCIYGFAVGALGYELWLRIQSGALGWPRGTLVEVGYLVLGILFIIYVVGTPGEYAAPFVFAAGVLIFAAEAGQVSRLMLIRPMRVLGVLSFSIYMTHPIVRDLISGLFTVLNRRFGYNFMTPTPPEALGVIGPPELMDLGLWGSDALSVIYLLITIGVSMVTYRLVEVPGQAFFGRIAKSMLTRREQSEAPRIEPTPL